MSAHYFFTLFRHAVLKAAAKNVAKEELCKLGAEAVAQRVTRCPITSKIAYDTSAFDYKKYSHKISFNMEGCLTYLVNEEKSGVVEEAEIEKVKAMNVKERERFLAKVNSEVDIAHNKAKKEAEEEEDKIFEEGRQKAKAKETGENKEEETNRVFNKFIIGGVVKKIPAKSTIADGLKGASWKNLAHEAALGLLDDPDCLVFEDDVENNSRVLSFVGEDDKIHKFVVKPGGIFYVINDELISFKGCSDILREFEKNKEASE